MSVKTGRGSAQRSRSRKSSDEARGNESRSINWFTISLYALMFILLAAFSGVIFFLIL